MAHLVKPLSFKPSRLKGLSDRLMTSHYENNYGGAVRRLNAIEAELARLDRKTAPGFLLNGLKREELIAANSMILHELYFEALGGDGAGPDGGLAAALEASFGSIAAWRDEFTAMGKALAGGSGWVVLGWSARHGRLINHWAADHTHALAGAEPVFALDMYEHAYHLDFGARAAAYVDAFMGNIDWPHLGQRFAGLARAAPQVFAGAGGIRVDELRAAQGGGASPILLDVRLREDRTRDEVIVPGAEWRDPLAVEDWAEALPADRSVVVYCRFGFEVGQGVASALARRGCKAQFLAGGLSAWRAEGGAVVSMEKEKQP